MPDLLQRIDWRAILVAVRLPAFYWILSLVIVTLFGYPGVICTTPIGWLLALPVGKRVVDESQSPIGGMRLGEAGLAGGFLGLLMGVLFTATLVTAPETNPSARGEALVISALVTLTGILTCAAAAALVAAAVLRRRPPEGS